VVGLRVIVRRVLPGEFGPTGGPAMTDVLGVCESWADGIAVIRREDGSTVAIRTREIVSGKPVPPRPNVRLRVSAREAEGHATPRWPGIDREMLGEWELRSEPERGSLERTLANSCLAMGDPGVALVEAARRVADFYAARSRPAMVQVETGSEEDRWFADAGWGVVPGGETQFLLGSTSRARRLLRGRATDEAELHAVGPRARAAVADLAFGKAVVDGDWLGLHGLFVAPDARRRGLARAVLSALLDWGAEQGGSTVWLYAEPGNIAATALYESLGLQVHHECRYLAAPLTTPRTGPSRARLR
jgi:ribosomal protein S18 acetylase RimI-like enzyme